jgi:uncharacterized protein (DUF1330 family)
MAAYMIVQITITDEEKYKHYRTAVVPLIANFGGEAVVRSGTVYLLEGHHDGRRMSCSSFLQWKPFIHSGTRRNMCP